MSGELPKGWVCAAIRDVTTPVKSVDPTIQPTTEFVYIDISAIDNQTFTIGETKKFPGSEAPSRARRPVQQDDILFSNVRTYLRNIALIDFACVQTLCSTGFTVLRPNSAIEPKFLFRFVLSDQFIDAVTPTQTGTHYPATSDAAVLSQEITLPPLQEQRRIVAKLEALLAKVDASRKRLERIPTILKRFHQSVLAAACDGRLTEDWRIKFGKSQEEWRTTALESICESISDGDHQPPPKAQSGIPFLTIGNIANGRLNFEQTRFVPEQYFRQIKNHRIPKPGDVLFSVVATIGIPVLVETSRPFCFQRHIALLRPSKDINPRFLLALMGSSKVVRECQELATGTAQPTLSLSTLRGIQVEVPPLDEQEEIVQRVQSLVSIADQIEARYAKAKAQVDRLTQSILAKAFRGELVPQDPNDEPADVLLSRLAAAPSEAPTPARRRGRPPRVQPAAPPVAPAAPVEGREAPALADLTHEAILRAHREVLASIPSPLSEDNLLRAVALRLGFRRLGTRIKARLRESLSNTCR